MVEHLIDSITQTSLVLEHMVLIICNIIWLINRGLVFIFFVIILNNVCVELLFLCSNLFQNDQSSHRNCISMKWHTHCFPWHYLWLYTESLRSESLVGANFATTLLVGKPCIMLGTLVSLTSESLVGANYASTFLVGKPCIILGTIVLRSGLLSYGGVLE